MGVSTKRDGFFSPMLRIAGVVCAMSCAQGEPATPAFELPASPMRPLKVPTRRLRRLSSREYNNVVRDLLGDTTRPADRFISDAYPNGYDNGSAGLAVQSDQVVDYQAAAEALAAKALSGDVAQLLGGCDVAAQGEAACAEAFLATTAPRAFRRPLTPTELQRLRNAFAAESSANGFARGIQTTLEIILQSPQFLYREELGPREAVPRPGATVTLSDYEVASEVSFLLTGSIPDIQLWTAVESGAFHTPLDYRREATRLLDTAGGREALRAFVHEWLATNRLPSLTKDKVAYPAFDASIAQSMTTELDRLYDDVLWNGDGSLRELFTTNRSFLDATLGQLYGVPGAGSFEPAMLDPQIRKGILSRAGYLAVHSATDSSGPIDRGVFVLQSIMCLPPQQPPANVPPAPAANDPSVQDLTTRQRFANHVSNPFCASCHTQIDGIGFGFEEFDGLGVFRKSEHGVPVDASGTIAGSGEIDGDYQGVGGLADRLAGSRLLADCYARQVYRYAMGQVEDPADDPRTLAVDFSTDARMTDLLIAIIDSPIFTTRTFETPNP